MHVKHVSNVTFYHLSNKCHENKCKDKHCAKYQHFTFPSFTVLNKRKNLQLSKVDLWSDFQQVIINTAIDRWRKHLRA